jgi:alkyl hydroperoxide reductase subunit AhpC
VPALSPRIHAAGYTGSEPDSVESQGKDRHHGFYPADWSSVCGDRVILDKELLPELHKKRTELSGISVDDW